MESQCLGLAEALGVTTIVKRVTLRMPWRQLSPYLRIGLSHAYSEGSDALAPPWPDILIATGRHSVPASLYVRRESRRAGKPTLTVQIQNPVIAPSHFDLVVTPLHDRLSGPNVISTIGALHRVTPERLAADAPNMKKPGTDLIAHYLDPDRHPVQDRWSRKHPHTQRRLCDRFAAPAPGGQARARRPLQRGGADRHPRARCRHGRHL